MTSEKPTVLVIGATGPTGRLILEEFDREPGDVKLRLAARKPVDFIDKFGHTNNRMGS